MQCLVILSRLNNKPISAEALGHGLPFDSRKGKQRLFSVTQSKANFSRAAQKAGFTSKLKKRTLAEIPAVVLPAILMLQDDTACVLTDISVAKGVAHIIVPSVDETPMEISLAKLGDQYLGYVFFLKASYEGFGQNRLLDKVASRDNWFFGTLLKFKAIYGRVLLATFLINLFVIAGPMFTMNVYDRIIPHNAVDTLWVLAIGIGFIYLFDMVLKFLRTHFLETAARTSDIILSSMLFEQALNIKMATVPNSVGSFISNVKDFDGIRSFFASTAITAFIELPFAIIFLLVIYSINPYIAIVPLVAIIIIILMSIPVKRSIQKIVAATHEAIGKRNSILVESLSNLETIKAFNANSAVQWHWEETTGDIAGKSLRSRIRFNSLSTLSVFISQVSSVLIVIVGVFLIKDGQLTMGGLIAVNILSSRAIAPMSQAVSLLANFEQTKAGLQALNELMKKDVERPEGKHFLKRPIFKGEIEFKDVSFTYPGEQKQALRNINFKIKPGERVGVIGQIGSGKSTIGRLLLNFYDPDDGAVYVDGLAISQIDPVDLRHHFNYVPQDVILFSGTVRDNIILKSPFASDEEVIAAAEVGQVNNFVDRHPLGMDLQVGERGFNLSGGQRQSVGVARGFIEESPICLLDEPTNAMDFNTESQVVKKLLSVTAGKTTIVFTHKPTILNIVDRIIVMDNGTILMDGPKKEILARLGGKTHAE